MWSRFWEAAEKQTVWGAFAVSVGLWAFGGWVYVTNHHVVGVLLALGGVASAVSGVAAFGYWFYREGDTHVKELGLRFEPVRYPREGHVWIQLRVTKAVAKAKAIRSLWCVIESYQQVGAVTPNDGLPPDSTHLVWSGTAGAGIYHHLNAPAYLDVALTKPDDPDHFFTPIPTSESGPAIADFPLLRGTYQVILKFGNNEGQVNTERVEFRLVYRGGKDLEVEDFKQL